MDEARGASCLPTYMTLISYFRLIAEDQPYASRLSWFWKPILKVASLGYGIGLRICQLLYQIGILKRKSFPCPVISIGNLTWGGTGKTPLVEYVSRFFLDRRNVPLVLSRGYGKDESKMLARELPQALFGIGKDRFQSGQTVLASRRADVIILDDGFQHWCLKRDLDIVVVNALNPFGNFSLIPRGILREPWKNLRRASLVVLTDVNLVPRKNLDDLKMKIRSLAPDVSFIEGRREPLYFYRPSSRDRFRPDRLQGTRVTSFSGIGTPRSFQILLNQLGIKTVRNFEFPDHHAYSERELVEVMKAKEASESQEIVTTEKDYFRSEEIMKKLRPLILKVRLRLTEGESLLHHFLGRFVRHEPREKSQAVASATDDSPPAVPSSAPETGTQHG